MTKVSMNVAERLQLLSTLNDYKGGYDELLEVWKVIEKIKFTEEEKADIGFTVQDTQVTWDAKKAKDIDVEFTLDEKKVVTEKFQALDKNGEITVQMQPLASVYTKLTSK